MSFLDTLSKIGNVALDLGSKAAQAGLLKVKELGYQTQKTQPAVTQQQPTVYGGPGTYPGSMTSPTFPNPPVTPDWIEALKRAVGGYETSPTSEPTAAPSAPAPKPAGGPADQTSILLLLALGAVLFLRRR